MMCILLQACECVHGLKEQKEPKSMKLERPSYLKLGLLAAKKLSGFFGLTSWLDGFG